jgi:hypothetical protein
MASRPDTLGIDVGDVIVDPSARTSRPTRASAPGSRRLPPHVHPVATWAEVSAALRAARRLS